MEGLGHDEMLSAGSLRIETFEGSRPRLRRTRGAMGIQSLSGIRRDVFAPRGVAKDGLDVPSGMRKTSRGRSVNAQSERCF